MVDRWRNFEGQLCTSPEPCNRNGFIFPVFEYIQSSTRCSITGGYVYRGSAGAVTPGTYVYGDFCSGEIFGWDGTTQSVLLDTTMNISSFGEDQAGELYVVNLGGSLMRIASTAPPCTYTISPASASYPAGGGAGNVTINTPTGCPWTAASNASWLSLGATSGSGPGSVGYTVAPYTGKPKKRNGTLTIAGQTFSVQQTK